ncbi:MAG: efflux RND transporter periplasmic adaptor subunit [Deltaproteobacteria bacterium]|nr:efflux RND transporter periplasmic adaptor subunit [Deltaproteobacteria bacterium]
MKSPGGMRIIGAIIVILLFVMVGYGLFRHRPSAPVTTVDKSEIQAGVRGPGTVQSRVPVLISARITGILEKLHADQGDRVRKGQLLAELDAVELEARAAAARAAEGRARRELARARADLVKAQANLGLAQSNYRRDQEVYKPGYISQAAFDAAEAQLRVAESEVSSVRAAVEALQAAVGQAESESNAAKALKDYTRILAPMDGLITVRKAEVGTTLVPGSPVFQMVDLNQIWVAAWIDQALAARLREGQPARITLRSGRVFQGKVARINAEGDTLTRELEVDVKFDRLPQPLIMGEEAVVDIDTGHRGN